MKGLEYQVKTLEDKQLQLQDYIDSLEQRLVDLEGFALDFVPLSLPAAPAPITPERESTLPTKALSGNKPPSGNKTLPGTKPINQPSTGNGPRTRSSSPSPGTKTSPGKPRRERLVRSPQPCARSTCGTAFASRNQLFTHLHETGYIRPEAILPPMPPSPTPSTFKDFVIKNSSWRNGNLVQVDVSRLMALLTAVSSDIGRGLAT
uniref:Uncharacterized protein n=1 Tax=Podospora anserina (strain S / ATCC MYA-4624 / DSM 980 / FGSC 10383) TaxID=515849 RepID=A0A090CKS2_PODAN|nr:Putative protein of unknown function [Podospora anserina S mat+]